MKNTANDTMTGRLFEIYATQDGGDFEFYVRCLRRQNAWTEFEIALSVKERIPDMRIEDVQRDMAQVAA